MLYNVEINDPLAVEGEGRRERLVACDEIIDSKPRSRV